MLLEKKIAIVDGAGGGIGAGRHRAPGVQARRAAHRGDRIAEVTTFGATLFPAFGLPPTR